MGKGAGLRHDPHPHWPLRQGSREGQKVEGRRGAAGDGDGGGPR